MISAVRGSGWIRERLMVIDAGNEGCVRRKVLLLLLLLAQSEYYIYESGLTFDVISIRFWVGLAKGGMYMKTAVAVVQGAQSSMPDMKSYSCKKMMRRLLVGTAGRSAHNGFFVFLALLRTSAGIMSNLTYHLLYLCTFC